MQPRLTRFVEVKIDGSLQRLLWDDGFLTGIEEIDVERRTLFVLPNDLIIAALPRHVSPHLAHRMLQDLQRHFAEPFQAEGAM
ncbi:MAG TPA: hypothetical protein VD978_24340 [Azospirillum sp.]|nr:hypothetical protein [Azospirillum sp.]